MIRNIVFDLNGVLLTYSKDALMKIADGDARRMFSMLSVLRSKQWQTYNLGTYRHVEECLKDYAKTTRSDPEDLKVLLTRFHEECYRIDDDLTSFMKDHPEYDYYLLSNTVYEQVEVLKMMPFYPLLKGAYCSCDVGMMKPAPAFFESFLKTFDLDPKECLFIDDGWKNTLAARQLGFRVITHFNRRNTLKKLGKGV